MKPFLTRRGFLATAAASAAATAASAASHSHPLALAGLLAGSHADVRVWTILQEHLALLDHHRMVAQQFTQSLQSRLCHTETPAEFYALLNQHDDVESLEQYVVQEFVVSTNYLEWQCGRETSLSLLG